MKVILCTFLSFSYVTLVIANTIFCYILFIRLYKCHIYVTFSLAQYFQMCSLLTCYNDRMNTSIYNISLLNLFWVMIPVAIVIYIYMRWTASMAQYVSYTINPYKYIQGLMSKPFTKNSAQLDARNSFIIIRTHQRNQEIDCRIFAPITLHEMSF